MTFNVINILQNLKLYGLVQKILKPESETARIAIGDQSARNNDNDHV
jgi:hypothetical protein